MIQHIRQHILREGIGFRQFLDIAIVMKEVNIDWEFVVGKANELGLYNFLCNILALIHTWFDIDIPFEICRVDHDFLEKVTERIFLDGVFGFSNEENKVNDLEREVRETGKTALWVKTQYALKLLFPKYKVLVATEKYPYLRGKPYLVPVVWIIRGMRALKNRDSQLRKTKNMLMLGHQDIDGRRELIRKWGLWE